MAKLRDERLEVAWAFREVMDSKAGKKILAHLEAMFGRNPFCPENDRLTSFNCGAIRVVQEFTNQYAVATSDGQMPQEVTTDG